MQRRHRLCIESNYQNLEQLYCKSAQVKKKKYALLVMLDIVSVCCLFRWDISLSY